MELSHAITGSIGCGSGLGSKYISLSSGTEIHDFTVYKIKSMIDNLSEEYVEHPDIYALKNILHYYLNDEIIINWVGGYPMVDIKV